MPHPPQVGQQVGICRGFVTKICPQGRGICITTLKASNTILNTFNSLVIPQVLKALTVLNGLKLNLLQSSLPYFNLNSANKVFLIQFPAFPHFMPGE